MVSDVNLGRTREEGTQAKRQNTYWCRKQTLGATSMTTRRADGLGGGRGRQAVRNGGVSLALLYLSRSLYASTALQKTSFGDAASSWEASLPPPTKKEKESGYRQLLLTAVVVDVSSVSCAVFFSSFSRPLSFTILQLQLRFFIYFIHSRT